jgi:hypothetical protein
MIAPDLRNLAAMAESETGFASIKAYDPAGPLLVMFHLSMKRHPTIRLHLVIGSDIILDQNWEAMERSQRNRQVSRPFAYSRHKTYQSVCTYPLKIPFFRSSSKSRAIFHASGLISTTARTVELTSSLRLTYAWDASVLSFSS